jgi:hypothetical protein
MKKFQFMLVLLLCCLTGLSCGPSSGIPGLVEVKGHVTYNNAPVDGATVTFSPATPSQDVRSAVSMTESDGSFILMTTVHRGILPGDYNVTVVKKSSPPPAMSSEEIDAYMTQHGREPPVERAVIRDLVPAKYGRIETSGLSFSVKRGMPPIEIELND